MHIIFTEPHPNAPGSVLIKNKESFPQPRLFLIGSFGVLGTDGQNYTPRSKKARGVLALLALAPRGTRTRVWLCDRLWSGSTAENSATSLRQTVFELKRDLGELAGELLEIDRSTLGLRLDRIWIDVHAYVANPAEYRASGVNMDTELLEGMDIPDEEFEEWLRMERQIWHDKIDQIHDTPANQTAIISQIDYAPGMTMPSVVENRRKLFSLGFLQNIRHGCGAETEHLADCLLDGVAQNLQELQPIDIFDFRDTNIQEDHARQNLHADFFIRVRTLQVQNALTLTFLTYRASSMALEWSQSINAPISEILSGDVPLLQGFIAQNVDRLAKTLFSSQGQSEIPGAAESTAIGYSALNMLFQLDQTSLQRSAALLDHAEQTTSNSIYPALKSYISSFIIGEHLTDMNIESINETRRLADSVVGDNPFNSISIACLGHVMGYVFSEHAMARNLLERALNLNSNQAFVWDHYALHNIYAGNYDQAYAAAKKANYLGSFSPISHSYDTTLCMAATMVGDHGTAINAGRRVLSKQPKFKAAMRYLLANYGMTGQVDKAKDIAQHLLDLDPKFIDPEQQKARFRLNDKAAETNILQSIRVGLDN
ncbi:transcriptional regulator [Parasulfitobacter algicola]|uniref:Transcriptional regulator n=1 Tax=Parasulfitobacter algicola TaxID=2614809 RepID=A0ABX2IN90_9RHOB|nr:transcriptional regulator [Sulfitobacter algicola]NSX54349.1 transcriptional regulator [Sulfitobacter algicola]